MINWIKKLFGVCHHEFEKASKPIDWYWTMEDKFPYKTTQRYVCKKCLKSKEVRLS